MEAGADIKVATITLWNFAAMLVHVVAFGIMYMKASKNKNLKVFFVVQLSMFIWLLGKVLKTVSPTVEMRWFFIVFYYFGICLLEASFLDFSYVYYKGKYMNRKIRILIYFIALCQFIFVATNPYHFLFYSRYSFWGDAFGDLFYAHVAVNYGFILLGMIFCSIRFKKHLSDKTRFQKNLITIAIITPLIFNFIYITRKLGKLFEYLNIQVFDITPIIYTWSILVFVYATFKYEFFELSPILKHEVSQKLDSPILVLSREKKILYSNTIFDHLFGSREKVVKDLNIEAAHDLLYHDDHIYKYSIDSHHSFEGKRYVIGFSDVTAYHMTKNALAKETLELASSNDKLENQIEMLKQSSLVGARNYIARELHDILGHSLVVTVKLLEVSKMYYKTNTLWARDSLEKASLSIKSGFDEMKSITEKDSKKLYNTVALEKEINSMLRVVDVSGVDVNFYLRSEKKLLDEKVYDTLKRVLTELVTNTLKHAKATKLLLTITVIDNHISLQTMDNGVGVKELIKGNGLKGIDGRLSIIGGKAKYRSEYDNGFSCQIMIPI